MASRSRAEICEILDENGPDLLESFQLSERCYQYLISEKVVQDNTLMNDLKVMKPTEQIAWILHHVRSGNKERYSGFIRMLILTGQEDIVKEILNEDPIEYIVTSSNLNEKDTCKFETLKRYYQERLGLSPLYEYATRSRMFQIGDVFTKLHLIDNENDALSHTMAAFGKEREHPSISLSEMFKTEDNALPVIVEGKAGSGKTTLLKHCTIAWARFKLMSSQESSEINTSDNLQLFEKDLVLFLDKKHEGKDLDETIRNAIKGSTKEKEQILTLFKQHPEQCFMFIDALDEFHNEKVRQEIFDLTTDGRTNILISCREGHPYLNGKMENFSRHVKVAGFKLADAHNFIQRFMISLMPEDEELCREKADKICSYLVKEKVRNLYVSPINCVFVCIAFWEGHLSEKDLDTLTVTDLFEKQQKMMLLRECHRQAGSSEHVEQCLTDAKPIAEKIYQLALRSLILTDQRPQFSKKQLEEFGIDLKSPTMVLLVKEIYVSSQGEEEVYSWPHETIKEFHAAKAVKNINAIYYIASKPELNKVTEFLIPMLAENSMELAKKLLKATVILQSGEPPCASSRVKRILQHCCTKISRLKKEVEKLDITDLLAWGIPLKLKHSPNMTEIQKCTRNTDWALKNHITFLQVAKYISESTSHATQIELAQSVLHPFLPSATERVRGYQKDCKTYLYPVHDVKHQLMIALHFSENSNTGDDEGVGVDGVGEIVGEETDEVWVRDLKGFCLYLLVDQTIQFDEFTMNHLQHLTRTVKYVDQLILYAFDHDDDDDGGNNDANVTWEKSSVTAILNIVKPKVGLILEHRMARMFKAEDLYQLRQDGVRFTEGDLLF